MNENLGRCPLCARDKQPGVTTFTVDLESGVVVVRGVPALVFAQCGESWLEEPVVRKLEIIVEDARRRRVVVEVTEWQQVA